MVKPRDLKVGDLLLLRDKSHNFYRHAAVLSEVDNENEFYKVIHWRGVGEPYAITEATLPSSESFSKRNVEFECYRLNNDEQSKKVVTILKSWLQWAVPYDKNRFDLAEKYNNHYFSLSSDLFNGLAPNVSPESYAELLENNRLEMERLFIEHHMDVVKYSARRDISPVRPKLNGEKQTGFHCLQGILLAFQVSYAQDFVNSINDKWLANKHVVDNSLLQQQEPRFQSSKIALKPGFDLPEFIDAVPESFRLYARLCSIDTFRCAILKDNKTFKSLGKLEMLKEADIKPDNNTMLESVRFFKSIGDKNRKELLDNVVTSSMVNHVIF